MLYSIVVMVGYAVFMFTYKAWLNDYSQGKIFSLVEKLQYKHREENM